MVKQKKEGKWQLRSFSHRRREIQSVCISFSSFSFSYHAQDCLFIRNLRSRARKWLFMAETSIRKPVIFAYRYHGKNINFFVLKIHDKVISFLDACRSCYVSKRGYWIDDGHITCKT
ncbi:MAG TPA: hypothetical protein DCP92_13980 [Nitrospiraceae bacterium]|nr:hypothetical protein [Nitrospiraceae bacterium]